MMWNLDFYPYLSEKPVAPLQVSKDTCEVPYSISWIDEIVNWKCCMTCSRLIYI